MALVCLWVGQTNSPSFTSSQWKPGPSSILPVAQCLWLTCTSACSRGEMEIAAAVGRESQGSSRLNTDMAQALVPGVLAEHSPHCPEGLAKVSEPKFRLTQGPDLPQRNEAVNKQPSLAEQRL